MEIEQLANQLANIAILANEWMVQWSQGFENLDYSARQIVPRRGQLNPTKFALRKSLATIMITYYEFHKYYHIVKPEFAT